MKQKILEMLQQADGPLSGPEISKRLSVSRVAVWKHIDQLRRSGLEIASTGRGYRLVTTPDTPLPYLFGARAARIHYYPELDSTMNTATTLAREGCPDGTVVIAGRQHQGRGRLQRQWQSAEGGLYFSLILRPGLPARVCPVVNLAVAVALAQSLQHCCGIDVRVKWPNDILADGHKIAGILAQMEVEAEQVIFLNIGIGVNLNNMPEVTDQPAVSVRQLIGRPVDRVRFLSDFLDRIEGRMTAFFPATTIADWKQRSSTLGRQVRIVTMRDSYEGLAVDLDEDGGLVLKAADGSHRTVFFGDCFHDDSRPAAPPEISCTPSPEQETS